MTQQVPSPVLIPPVDPRFVLGRLNLSQVVLKEEYKDVVKKAVIGAAGVSVPGTLVPGVDMAGTATVWTTMIGAIAKKSGREIDVGVLAKMAGSAAAGVAGYYAASKFLTYAALPLLVVFPVAGIPAVAGLNSALNAILTYRLAKIASELISNPAVDEQAITTLGRDVAGYMKGIPTMREVGEIEKLIRSK
jgi:hypothetical protein